MLTFKLTQKEHLHVHPAATEANHQDRAIS